MLVDEVQQLLSRLREGIRQPVSLECSCDNLETVYVHLESDGRVRIDDDHQTFKYLTVSEDETYVPVDDLDLARVSTLVRDRGLELLEAPEDGFRSIATWLAPEQPIADAVERVADAIDAIFELALRAPTR
jgi:hypothetical protein